MPSSPLQKEPHSLVTLTGRGFPCSDNRAHKEPVKEPSGINRPTNAVPYERRGKRGRGKTILWLVGGGEHSLLFMHARTLIK